MSVVIVEPAELRRLIGEAVESALSRVSAADEWVDARTSPLPRRAFLKLAREGAFPASLVGNKFMVRRRDVEAYIERQRIRPEMPRQVGCVVPRYPLLPSAAGPSNDDPVARALAAGRLRIVKTSE